MSLSSSLSSLQQLHDDNMSNSSKKKNINNKRSCSSSSSSNNSSTNTTLVVMMRMMLFMAVIIVVTISFVFLMIHRSNEEEEGQGGGFELGNPVLTSTTTTTTNPFIVVDNCTGEQEDVETTTTTTAMTKMMMMSPITETNDDNDNNDNDNTNDNNDNDDVAPVVVLQNATPNNSSILAVKTAAALSVSTEEEQRVRRYHRYRQLQQQQQTVEIGRVTSVTLVNCMNGNDIVKITQNGQIIDIGKYDSISFTIRANIQRTGGSNSGVVVAPESVIFDFDGKTTFFIDNTLPYTLSDKQRISIPRLALNGQHTIAARAKQRNNGKGVGSKLFHVYFTIINSTLNPCTMDIPKPNSIPSSRVDTDVPSYKSSPQGTMNGELRLWHKITIGFRGPMTCERAMDMNPYTDIRLDVIFTSSSNKKSSFIVPGYYAANGNSANTGATTGNVWLVHFTPNQTGKWNWIAKFKKGTNIIMKKLNDDSTTSTSTTKSAGYFDGVSGSFTILRSNKSGPTTRDHRYHGILEYVHKHHLRYRGSGKYFMKVGVDSPENFLAYIDFDNTPNYHQLIKSWNKHQRDYRTKQNTTWRGGKGTEIIGAINYLSNVGMNVFSFLTMNINGDDRNVFPYVSDHYTTTSNDRLRIDVSKTAQWEVIFEHADHMGMYLHFKTQEHENDQLLDNGELGIERTLYYRELIARFSHHHALNWNIGEETSNTARQQKMFAQYFYDNDPYRHHVVIHTNKPKKQDYYPALLGLKTYTGASLQCYFENVYSDTTEWITRSASSGQKWVVTIDESGEAHAGTLPDKDDPQHNDVRKYVLWGNIMAGGAGIELYFGYRYSNSDLTCQDFRSRSNMWKQAKHALHFFDTYEIPFWDWDHTKNNKCKIVSSSNNGAWCLVDTKKNYYVVYLYNGGSATLDTTNAGPIGTSLYTVKWYDPRNGGNLQNGSISTIESGKRRTSIGRAPKNTKDDWVVLIRRNNMVVDDPNPTPVQPEPPVTVVSTSAPVSKPTVAPVAPVAVTPPDVVTPTVSGLPYVIGFKLVNAKTNVVVDNGNWWLQNNDIIDTNRYGISLSIRAYVGGIVGSVKFGLDNDPNYNMDKAQPWLLGSDYQGNYNPVSELVTVVVSGDGDDDDNSQESNIHIITATPYKRANGGGKIGISKTITIRIV